jgi:C1A family cysteine protease
MKHYNIYKLFINFMAFLSAVLISSPLPAIEATDINQAIRAKGANWVAGETSVSKLSPDEIRRRLMPIKSKNTEKRAKSYRYSAKVNNLPTKVDWRNVNGRSYVTGVRDQGNCGSCWAFASTAALESRILITSQTPDMDLDLSEQAMVSCDDKNDGCAGGWPDLTMAYLKTTGLPLETDAPYMSGETGITGACTATMQQNTYRVTSFEDVATSVEAIKNAIAQHGPVVTGFTVYTDFLSYQSGVYSHVTGFIEGNHMVTIVGYDDAEQAWIIKNSWGPDWGENGFFRMKAGTNECDIEDEVYTYDYATVPGTSFVLSPSSADFGTLVLPDQLSASLPFTITNNGSVPLTTISSAVTNPRYSVSPLTVSTLASAASADIQVTYTSHAGKIPDIGELHVVSAGVTRESPLSAQTNTRPAQPVNLWPSDNATTGLSVTLVGSAFVDADDDAHEASQWIIQNDSGGIVYSGSFDAVSKTSFTVPSGILQENTPYYWQVIYRDDRGVVSSASVLTAFTAASPMSGSKGGCFIATAAFGSPMAGQVEILRQFRDRCLLTNNIGQKFVAWYYRNSPAAARFIEDKPLAKVASQAALYPLIGFSFLLLAGYLPFLFVGLLLGTVLFFLLRAKKLSATS